MQPPTPLGTNGSHSIWVYGDNEHVEVPNALPAGFPAIGSLSDDFQKLCEVVGAVPHPVLRAKSNQGESSTVAFRSVLLDLVNVKVLSLLLPVTCHVKVLCFSDCRLDEEMLKLLHQGLSANNSVETLQIEWNPLELPLPSAEEVQVAPAHGEEAALEAATAAAAAAAVGADQKSEEEAVTTPFRDLEVRERRRYFKQCTRLFGRLREWLEASAGGGLEAAWMAFKARGTELTVPLSADKFHDVMAAQLGNLAGTVQLVNVVFEVLDGPLFGACKGGASLAALQAALEGLAEEPNVDPESDPIGLMLAPFLDGECVAESISFRACAIGCPEVTTMAATLANASSWQLRHLNLWENYVCDRGAAALAVALREYRGLEFLGCGRNRITDAGLASLCQPFHATVLDEASLKSCRENIKQQESQKAKASGAKAKAKPTTPSARRNRREKPVLVDVIEESRGMLRRPCELRMLALEGNPIRSVEEVEALLPLGPPGAELVLRGTPVAAALLAKQPREGESQSPLPEQEVLSEPSPEGWVLRLT